MDRIWWFVILTTPPLYDRSGSEQKLAGRLAGTHEVFIDSLASLFGGLATNRGIANTGILR
jgi:hypothetical protein